jgi:NAD-dependent SIR2 family protein deacetylase
MSVEDLAAHITRAGRLTVLTGAGVSAASGVPTFRGAEGLWRQYRPEDLATQTAFRRDPSLVWEWYAWRRELVGGCTPNPGHDVLARWSRQRRCTVVTQNVDDLHHRAGTEGVIRLHGSLWELRCSGIATPVQTRGRNGACHEEWRDERVPLPEMPPRCPRCGGLARPAIVWFGEALRDSDLRAATAATRCDLFIAVGTSAIVHPAAGLLHEAKRHGAVTAEINPVPTPASGLVDIAIQGTAEDVLPRLDLLLKV